VRADLGLPTRADELRDIETQLAALIAGSGEVLLTWQRQLGGENNLFSPLLARLLALDRLAYGTDLTERALAARLPYSQVASPQPAPLPGASERPRPVAAAHLVPREISASGYNALVACPYQFYAGYMLGLKELDEVQDLIDKRDYGSLLHGVLARFHPRLSGGLYEQRATRPSARFANSANKRSRKR
jgi:ATP-dependent helicase/nuclease subunit B